MLCDWPEVVLASASGDVFWVGHSLACSFCCSVSVSLESQLFGKSPHLRTRKALFCCPRWPSRRKSVLFVYWSISFHPQDLSCGSGLGFFNSFSITEFTWCLCACSDNLVLSLSTSYELVVQMYSVPSRSPCCSWGNTFTAWVELAGQWLASCFRMPWGKPAGSLLPSRAHRATPPLGTNLWVKY